jgi:molybdopterin molybdotransferase
LAGLPGNPLACLVGWRFLVRPLAEVLAGDSGAFDEQPLTATLHAPARNKSRHTALLPAVLSRDESALRAEIVPWKGSHDVTAAAPANAVVRLEPGADLDAGANVSCYQLPWRSL